MTNNEAREYFKSKGLDYSILKEKNSVQWPFTPDKPEGTSRLFEDKKGKINVYQDCQNQTLRSGSTNLYIRAEVIDVNGCLESRPKVLRRSSRYLGKILHFL